MASSNSSNNSFITDTADADVVLSVETENLVTCSVCLYEYDQDIRQPKCIPCSHTFCSLCLELIRRENWIQCPLCRQVLSCSSTDDLPNNTAILHILKLQAKMAKDKEKHQDEIEFLSQSLKICLEFISPPKNAERITILKPFPVGNKSALEQGASFLHRLPTPTAAAAPMAAYHQLRFRSPWSNQQQHQMPSPSRSSSSFVINNSIAMMMHGIPLFSFTSPSHFPPRIPAISPKANICKPFKHNFMRFN